MKAWHYTTPKKFELIKQSGLLLPAKSSKNPAEHPILWFSIPPTHTFTAFKLIADDRGGSSRLLTLKEVHEHAGGLVRFGIPTNMLKRGNELRREANISGTAWRRLEESRKKMKSNPVDWLGHVGSLELSDVSIEVMDGNMVWRPLNR